MNDVAREDMNAGLVARVVISLKGGRLIVDLARLGRRHQLRRQLPAHLLRHWGAASGSTGKTARPAAQAHHRSRPLTRITRNLARHSTGIVALRVAQRAGPPSILHRSLHSRPPPLPPP